MPYVTVASGFSVSSSFVLDPPGGGFAVFVASHASRNVACEFTTQSGGDGELSFYTYESPQGNAWVISSATSLPGVGLVERALTPWGRLKFGSNALSTTSAQIVPVR